MIPENSHIIIQPNTKFKILNRFNALGDDSLIGIKISGIVIPGQGISFSPVIKTNSIEWEGVRFENDAVSPPLVKISLSNAEYGIRTNKSLVLLSSKIDGCKYGIYMDSTGNGMFLNDTVINNEKGFYFIGNGIIKKSRIEDNETGVYMEDSALISMGSVNGNNTIINEVWDVYNNTPNVVHAKVNYWGSEQTEIIEGRIFDKSDDSTKGKVIIEPILGQGGPFSLPRKFEKPEKLTLISLFPQINRGTFTAYLSVPEKTTLIFKIYDTVGRRVKTYEHKITQPGFYNISIKIDSPSGVYFIGLKDDEVSGFKKFIVMR